MKKIALLALLLASCDAAPAYDRAAMLESLSDVVAVPAYRAFEAEAEILAGATGALCEAPSEETLGAARDAWRGARTAFKRTEAFGFGPAMERRIDGAVDFWPTRVTNIELAIRDAGPFDAAWFESAGTSVKGLPALEYLLFDPARTDAELLARLGEDPRRCAYVAGLGGHVAAQASLLVEAWQPGYRDMLVTDDPHASVSLMVNHQIAVLEDVKLNRLSKPLGLDGAGPDPEAVESPYAGHDVAGMLATLRGVRDAWTGDRGGVEGIGLDDYVASRDPELAADVTRRLDDVVGLTEAIDPPLRDRIAEGHTNEAEQLHQALRETQRLFAADVAMTLAVTVTFTDNDGD